MNFLLSLLVVGASVLGAGMAYPQARRVASRRCFDGVSPVWAGVSLASNSWWLAYAVFAEVFVLVPVSIASIALYGSICFVMARDLGRPAALRIAAGAAVLAVVPLPFLHAGGWPLAGVAIGLCYGAQLVPAVVAACRSRELAGIAPGTWMMAWAEAALWAVYSAVVLDPALAVGGAAGLTMSTAILARLAVTGHRPFELLSPRRLRVVPRTAR